MGDDDEIIMINDAYDVVILEDSETILNKFHATLKKEEEKDCSCTTSDEVCKNKPAKEKKGLIFGVQHGILPSLVFYKFKGHIICTGNIIGYVKYFKQLVQLMYKYKHVWGQFKNDDQVILGYVIRQEYDWFDKYITVDEHRDLFFATSGDDLVYP